MSFLQTILPDVTFMLTETTENRHENDSCPVFFITNSSVIHNERLKRLYRMTDFFMVYQIARKHNRLEDSILREPLKISIFAHNFSEARK